VRSGSWLPSDRLEWKDQDQECSCVHIVPAVLAVGVLAGCGQTGVESGAAKGTGSAQVRMPSTEVCHASAYIREQAPEVRCTDSAAVKEADDDCYHLGGR
jgi:hypothetical protein